MDQILFRRFRYLWGDRDEPSERKHPKEEEVEDVNAADEKYVYSYDEETYVEEEEEEEEETYVEEEEEEEEEETYVEEEDEEEENVSAAVEKYVYIYDYDEEEEETYVEEEETYAEEDEEGEDVNAAVEKYVYGMSEEEEEEEETVKAYVNAMAKRYVRMGPNPDTTPQVSFLNVTNSSTNAASASQEKCKIKVTGVKWIKHYCSDYKILLVGEGDFSFSASLAAAFGSATNITATSIDSFEFLVRNYRNAVSNIVALKNYGATVLHGVDATEMANLSPFKRMRRFDRVVYNFPLAGFFPNQTREVQIGLNQTLVKLFLENAKKMIGTNGEIHITHKCYGFFREWKLEALASRVGLRLQEEVHFDLSDYPGYNTKYGFGGDRNFDCSRSKTYKFVHKNPIELEGFM